MNGGYGTTSTPKTYPSPSSNPSPSPKPYGLPASDPKPTPSPQPYGLPAGGGGPGGPSGEGSGEGAGEQPKTEFEKLKETLVEDAVDRSDNEYIIDELKNQFRYEKLDNRDNADFLEGSELKQIQKNFESYVNSNAIIVDKQTFNIQGTSSAGFGVEEVVEYIVIAPDGSIMERFIDVNNDGYVDFIRR